MYLFSPDEVEDKLPEDLLWAFSKVYDTYQMSRKELEKKTLNMESTAEEISAIAELANKAWLDYKRVNKVVFDFLKKRPIRRDVWESITNQREAHA